MRHREQGRGIIVLALVCACLAITIGLANAQNPPQPLPARQVNQQSGDQLKKSPQRQEARAERQSQDIGEGSIKMPTEMVQLDVKAPDQTGRPAPGLTKNDFVVYEDKVGEKCLCPVENLLQLLISFGFQCQPPACLRYCRVTYPKTLPYVLEICSAVFLTAIEADISQQLCSIPKFGLDFMMISSVEGRSARAFTFVIKTARQTRSR